MRSPANWRRYRSTAGWVVRADLSVLMNSELDSGVRLLPAFDPLLLANARRDHLIETRHYTRVYRSQGWLSPVVLAGGKIVGVWFAKSRSKALEIDVQPFTRFLETSCQVRFANPD